MRLFINTCCLIGLACVAGGLTLILFRQWAGLLILSGGVLIFTAGLILRNHLIDTDRF